MCQLSADIFNMETFFPSEIARLVLGYLKEEKCLKSWQTFLEESSKLQEYFNLYKKGKVYSTNVNGNSLVDILNEYCVLKFEAISNHDNEIVSSGKAYISEANFLKTIRKDIFVETTKNAIELAFQKHLSSSVCNHQNSSLVDLSLDVTASESSDDRCSNKDQKSNNTDISKNLLECRADDHGNKQNKVTSVTNEIISRNKNRICKQSIVQENLNSGKNNNHPSVQSNISQLSNTSCHSLNSCDSSNSKLIHLHEIAKRKNNILFSSASTDIMCKNYTNTSDFVINQINSTDNLINKPSVSGGCNRDVSSINNKSNVVEYSSIAGSVHRDKENTVSSTESAQVDDVQLELIKEIKNDVLNNRVQSTTSGNSPNNQTTTDIHSSNCDRVMYIPADICNNITINQSKVCNGDKVTLGNNSKQKVNSSKSPVIAIQASNSSDVRINQSSLCSNENKVKQINNSEHKVNSSINQASNNSNSSPFLKEPATVNNMPFTTSPAYILPSYTSNGSLINNNAQYYFVVNTPGISNGPIISGTFLTLPSLQANNGLRSILPAVRSTYVEKSMSTPACNISNNPSRPKNTTDTPSAAEKSQILLRVPKRVSYVEFTDEETEAQESNSPLFSKRKKTPPKGSPKKKNKKEFVLEVDQPGQVQKPSTSKKQSLKEGDHVILSRQPQDVHKRSKRKKAKKKSSSKKKKAKPGDNVLSAEMHVVGKTKQKVSYNQSVKQPEKNFGQHPEKEHFSCTYPETSYVFPNPVVKTKEVTPCEVIDSSIPVSSLFNSFNNSDQSVSSKTMSENTNHSAVLNENRVLKVVLSDMFSKRSQEHQHLYSNSDLVEHNTNNEDQISNLEKALHQNRRSLRGHLEEKVKLSYESKSMDTVSLQQKKKVLKPPNPPLLTNEIKICPSNAKNKSNKNSSTFDVATAVLNNVEEVPEHAVTSKKHTMLLETKDLNLQNSSKNVLVKALKPQAELTFQSVTRDTCDNTECIELESTIKVIDNEESIYLPIANDGTLPSFLDIEKNREASSTNGRRENSKNTINVMHHRDNRSMVLKELTVQCANIISSLGNSDFEKCSSLSQNALNLEQNNETEKIKSEQRKEIFDQYENTTSISTDSDFVTCSNLFLKLLEQTNETEKTKLEHKKEISKYENNASVSTDFAKCSSLSQEALEKNYATEKTTLEQRNEISDQHENSLVSNISDFMKCSTLSQMALEQKNETEEIVSLKISKKDLSNVITAEKQVVVSDCIIKEKQGLLSDSFSRIHISNIKTSVTGKLGEKCLDLNTLSLSKDSVCSDGNYIADKDLRNSSHEVFKAESNSLNTVNIRNDKSDFIYQASETSVISVMSSLLAKTEILSIAEKHNETKPYSETRETSSIKENNLI